MSDSRKRTTPADRLEIVLAHEFGESISQISRDSGFSRATVSRVLGRRASPAVEYSRVGPRANPCGTNAAYWRHRRRGERPCLECYEAHARDTAEHKARAKERVRALAEGAQDSEASDLGHI